MSDFSENQIAQLIAYYGSEQTNPQIFDAKQQAQANVWNAHVRLSIPKTKQSIQEMLQILLSGDDIQFAGMKLDNINTIFLLDDGNRMVADNVGSLPQLGIMLRNLYNVDYQDENNDAFTKHFFKPYGGINPSLFFKKDKIKNFIIDMQFVSYKKPENFKSQVLSQLEEKLEFEEIDNFTDFLEQYKNEDYYSIKQDTKNKYQRTIEELNKPKEQDVAEEIDLQEEPEEEPTAVATVKRKKKKPAKQPTRIQPTRRARFTGKYGKGIDFDSINTHLIRLHSNTGNYKAYIIGRRLQDQLKYLQQHAARKA
jgi:hypothetical protein